MFSAAVIAHDLNKLFERQCIRPIELLVAGGGCRNVVMFDEIVSRCRGIRICTTNKYGMPIKAREAFAFALLAWWHVLKYRGHSPGVTGAKKSILLGVRVDPV